MKKLFIPTIPLLALCLTSCNQVKYPGLKIACPSGAPALALYDAFNDTNVEINGDATNIAGYLAKDSEKDIVIAPTNLLVSKVIKDEAPFKIAAVITFGNFYIASTGNDDNDTFDKDDYIVLFQQNGLPDKLFKYVYGTDFYNLNYVSSVKDAVACLKEGTNSGDNNASVDYVLVAQPALTPALQAAKNNRPEVADKIKVVKDVQEDYTTKTGDNSFTQASIFVKNTSDENQVTVINNFLDEIKANIEKILVDQSDLDAKLSKLEDTQIASVFGATNLTILKKVVKENSLNIGFKEAKEEKAAIDKFLINLGFTSAETSESLYW